MQHGCFRYYQASKMKNYRLLYFILLLGLLHCSIVFSRPAVQINSDATWVSYTMFGAKLDGKTDDYNAIKKCHEYANINNLAVVQQAGTIFISGNHKNSIKVRTNTDLHGCTMIIDDSFMNHPVYEFVEDPDNEFVDISSDGIKSKDQYVIGCHVLPSLKDYKHSFFVVEGSRILGTRQTPQLLNYKNRESFTILSDGVLSDGPLYCDYSSDDIKLKVKSTTTRAITVRLPKLKFKIKKARTSYNKCFVCSRNNVRLELPRELEYTDYPTDEETSSAMCLVSFRECCGVKVYGGDCENKGRLPDEKLQRACYVLGFSLCSDITVENVKIYRGWGGMNSEFIKTITVRDSYLNRFDNHFGISNIFIENCTFVGSNDCINVGYGNGQATIRDIRWILARTSSYESYTLLNMRKDIRLSYKGDVYIENADIVATEGGKSFTLIRMTDNYKGDNNSYIECDNIVNSIFLKNLKVDKTIRDVRLLSADFSESSKVQRVNHLTFDNIRFENEIKPFYIKNNRNEMPKMLYFDNVTIKDCFFPKMKDWGSIEDIVINNFTYEGNDSISLKKINR